MTGLVEVVCRPASEAGFALAGLAARVVPDPLDPVPAIDDLVARAAVGVVLIEESIYDGLPAEQKSRLDRLSWPVVVPFPGPARFDARSAEERVIDLLRRAIGYRVKLQ
jgi:vacuolar-type H+-ATPase subunit F/Vma7